MTLDINKLLQAGPYGVAIALGVFGIPAALNIGVIRSEQAAAAYAGVMVVSAVWGLLAQANKQVADLQVRIDNRDQRMLDVLKSVQDLTASVNMLNQSIEKMSDLSEIKAILKTQIAQVAPYQTQPLKDKP